MSLFSKSFKAFLMVVATALLPMLALLAAVWAMLYAPFAVRDHMKHKEVPNTN